MAGLSEVPGEVFEDEKHRLGLVNYEDSDDDAPEAQAATNGSHEKAAATVVVPQASPPSSSPPSGSPPEERERKPPSRASPPASDLVRRPTMGPPPASRDWSNPYILERLVQKMGLKQYRSNFPKEIFDPEHVEHPSDFYDAPECERPPPPKRTKKGEKHKEAPKSPAPGTDDGSTCVTSTVNFGASPPAGLRPSASLPRCS